jgi:hypothetical protein
MRRAERRIEPEVQKWQRPNGEMITPIQSHKINIQIRLSSHGLNFSPSHVVSEIIDGRRAGQEILLEGFLEDFAADPLRRNASFHRRSPRGVSTKPRYHS